MKKVLIPLIGLVAVACSNSGTDTGQPSSTTTTTGTSQPATTGASAQGSTAATASTTGTTPSMGGTTGKASGGTGFAAVASIASSNCMPCHSAQRKRGGLDLSSYAGLMKGGSDGQVVKPGDPDHSILVEILKGPVASPKLPKMPPGNKVISDADQKTIADWIKDGAKQS